MRHRFLAVLTTSASFAILLTSVHISLADVIDGDWCRADGKRMKIHGPEIVTPGGNQTRGDCCCEQSCARGKYYTTAINPPTAMMAPNWRRPSGRCWVKIFRAVTTRLVTGGSGNEPREQRDLDTNVR